MVVEPAGLANLCLLFGTELPPVDSSRGVKTAVASEIIAGAPEKFPVEVRLAFEVKFVCASVLERAQRLSGLHLGHHLSLSLNGPGPSQSCGVERDYLFLHFDESVCAFLIIKLRKSSAFK